MKHWQPRRFNDLYGGHSRIRTYDFHRVKTFISSIFNNLYNLKIPKNIGENALQFLLDLYWTHGWTHAEVWRTYR
jgi:hypothetical protein